MQLTVHGFDSRTRVLAGVDGGLRWAQAPSRRIAPILQRAGDKAIELPRSAWILPVVPARRKSHDGWREGCVKR
jgi:hypothetical protein